MAERGTRCALAAIVAVLVFSAFGVAQIRDRTQQGQSGSDSNQTKVNAKTSKRGPRAIAVIEFLPGGGARLVPVALWIDDRFYDASLYGADPEPMALQPETVYEATNYGEPTGLFTVTTPEQVKGTWVAKGQWKAHSAFDDKMAQQPAKAAKPPQPSNPLDDRPVLRRPGSSGSSPSDSSNQGASASGSSSSSAGNAAPSGNEPPDRPTLKKPQSEAPAAASSPAQQGAPAAKASASASSSRSLDENDPNRPTLRRGKPSGSATESAASETMARPSPAAKAAQAATPETAARPGRHSYPAVSDAGKYETRSLLYAMNSAERDSKAEQMRSLALEEIKKFSAKRNTPGLPQNASISDYDLRAFDLDYSNSPTFVFTGTVPVPGAKAFRAARFEYYVSVVAHEDMNGAPIMIFSSVTDSNHLDAFSRMEIIDAVDANADGRGDLLFREYSDVGISYSLYRVYPYDMRKLFDGGASM